MFKHKNSQMIDLKLNRMSNFHPLEVVDRGSETQFQITVGNEMSL